MNRFIIPAILVTALAASSSFADVLDGSKVGDSYGAAKAVQQVQTGFGDNLSELNAGYAVASNGMLKLMLTGQVESNFNKLNIFIDSVAGGQNTIGPDTNNGGVNPGSNNDGIFANYSGVGVGGAGNGPGFTFDTGFNADYVFIARNGFDGSINRFDFNFLSIGNASVAEEALDIFGGSLTGANSSVTSFGIGVGYDNSNTAGVTGGTGAADPLAALAVDTGLELWIPLAAIGNPGIGDTILISAHVNGSNHDFLSNQSLGSFVPPQGNPGGDGLGGFNDDVSQIDLNNFLGIQYFSVTVVPEPSAVGLLGLVAVAGLVRRRRK